MPLVIQNKDDGKKIFNALHEGRFADNPEKEQEARSALSSFMDRMEAIKKAPPGKDNAKLTANEPGLASDVGRRAVGALGVAATVANAAIVEPLAGITGLAAGLIGLVKGDGFSEPAIAAQNAVHDALTFNPRTQTGDEMLQSLVAPLQKLDDGADWLATWMTDNPYAQATIYSALTVAPDILGFKGGAILRSSSALSKRITRIERSAARIGVDLEPSTLASSIVDAAKEMTPTVRAANAQALQQALLQQKALQKASAASKGQNARGTKTFVNVKEAKKFSNRAATELLEEGFDIADMPNVKKALKALEELDIRSPSTLTKPRGKGGQIAVDNANVTVTLKGPRSVRVEARITDIETIRNRIDQVLVSRKSTINKPKTRRENLALTQLEGKMTNWLDQQFNTDMITGDVRGIRRWKEAVEARQSYNKRFLDDKTLVQMMDRDATPVEINRWLMGASAAGAKPQAVAVIRRIKQVLGKEHPSVEGIRQDFLFELAKPLYQDVPNYRQFVRNFDDMVQNQSHLVKELDLDLRDIRQLRDFATAATSKNTKALFNPDMAKALAVMGVGSGLAKKALFVRTITFPLRMLGRLMFGKTILAKKGLIMDMAGANWERPFMDSLRGPAGTVIAAAALSNLDKTAREQANDQKVVGN